MQTLIYTRRDRTTGPAALIQAQQQPEEQQRAPLVSDSDNIVSL